jgi:hypothetical protein
MRRLLLALLAAFAVLPAANASAAFITHDVRLSSFLNSTGQTLTVAYDDSDPLTAPKTVRVPPDGGLPVMGDDTVSLSLANCGPARLTLSNPLVGRPSATLDDRFGGDSARFDEGERKTLEFDGVRVVVKRGRDADGNKDFSVEVLACRATPTATQIPAPVSMTAVRATVHNGTTQPVDVGSADADGTWRAITLAPGATSASFGADDRVVQLLLSDCGPARVRLADFTNGVGVVQVWGQNWPWNQAGYPTFGVQRTFSAGGNQLTVTREATTQYAVDLVACAAQ